MSHDSIDLRAAPPAEWLSRLLGAFGALTEGDSFVVVSDGDLRPLYSGFRSETAGRSGWYPVLSGPPEWRFEIFRLPPMKAETEISAGFGRDHDELDVLFAYASEALHEAFDGNPDALETGRVLFAEFDARIDHHIEMEEEHLFPAVEERIPGLRAACGRERRFEHVQIRKFKADLGKLLRSTPADLRRASGIVAELRGVLVAHNRNEESEYYGPADRLLSPAARKTILDAFTGTPGEVA